MMSEEIEVPKPKREDLLADVFPGVARARVELNGHIFTFPAPASIKIKAHLVARRSQSKYPPETGMACLRAAKSLADYLSHAEDHLAEASFAQFVNRPQDVHRWIAAAHQEFEAAEHYWRNAIADEIRALLKV